MAYAPPKVICHTFRRSCNAAIIWHVDNTTNHYSRILELEGYSEYNWDEASVQSQNSLSQFTNFRITKSGILPDFSLRSNTCYEDICITKTVFDLLSRASWTRAIDRILIHIVRSTSLFFFDLKTEVGVSVLFRPQDWGRRVHQRTGVSVLFSTSRPR